MKSYKIVKYVLYVAGGITIFILNNYVMPYVGYLVGGIIFVYSADEFSVAIKKRELVGKGGELFPVLSQVLIGVLLVLTSESIQSVCIIWGVWSILREAKELTHAITNLTNKKPGILNSIESIAVIAMSFFMVLAPSEHHAHTHVILLGIELICVVLFDLIELFHEKRNREKPEQTEEGTAISEENSPIEEVISSEESDDAQSETNTQESA